jgi:8-oxo-dGTP pyrophosphatase MutT (NUDIX family)
VSAAVPDRANAPDELLDIVDAGDRVIGTALKRETEREPSLIHREVAILIHRGNELLWQLRSAAKTVEPLTWDVACAGHVGAGERPAAAARRELHEELGLDAELTALERRLVHQPRETYFAYVFAAALPPGAQLTPDADEIAALEWCDETGYRSWRAQGRALTRVGGELSEAFWAGRWRPEGR